MTRKHAVPIFEFFDRQQITSRSGDLRTAGRGFRCPLTRRSCEILSIRRTSGFFRPWNESST